MNHAIRAAITLAFGVGLAAAAQAQGTYGQSNAPAARTPSTAPTATIPGTAPSATMQSPSPATNLQATAPAAGESYAVAGHRLSRNEVRQAQEQLKSEGLYRGAIDGKAGHQTRMAIVRFQQRNGLRPTARLDEETFARLTGSQTTGVGSSGPSVLRGSQGSAGMTPPATPTPPATQAPTGAGGSNPTSGQTLNH